MSRNSASRRQFLQTSAAAAAAASVPYFAWESPLIAQDAKTTSKNDRPLLGCIGTGDRWNAVGPQKPRGWVDPNTTATQAQQKRLRKLVADNEVGTKRRASHPN